MADSLEHNRDVIKLNDPRDYPLWCVQVRNALRTKRCEQAIQPNFLEPTRQTAVDILEAEGWNSDECEDIKLISDKLRTEKATYETAKAESVGVIQSRIHRNRLNLLEGHTTALAMWNAIREEFDITRASEIGSIAARVISKSFMEFATIEEYCRAYQEAYDDIASRLANKNGNKHQTKHYEVLLQGAMLDKLPEAYAPLTSAMDEDWLDYTYADLRNTIHRITRYLKNDPLKVLHTTSATSHSTEANPNKRQRVNPPSSPAPPPCKQPVCLSKRLRHTAEKCWELHPELRPSYRKRKDDLADIKIKGTASASPAPDVPIINLS